MVKKGVKTIPWGQISFVWLLILSLGLLVYSNTWHAPFVFDDVHSIVENEGRRTLDLSWRNWLGKRSLPNISFDLNYYWHEYRVTGYHAVNIGIHLATSLTVFYCAYLLAGRLLKDGPVKIGRWWFDSRILVGAVAGLFFLVHPIQTQGVTYIVQRLASMATLFYAQSVMWYLFYRTDKSGWRYVWALLSITGGIAAMHAKEISFTLPIVIILLEFVVWPVSWSRQVFRQSGIKILKLIPWLLLIVIIPAYLTGAIALLIEPATVAQEGVNNSSGESAQLSEIGSVTRETQGIDRWLYLKTQFAVIAKYIRLILLPVGQNIDHDQPWAGSLWSWRTGLSLLGLIALFGLSVSMLLRQGTRMMGLGGMMFFIMLSVESSIIPIKDVMFEHRLYLPMTGVSIMVGAAGYQGYRWLASRPSGKKWRSLELALLAVYLAVLGGVTWHRNSVWADDLSLWRDATAKSPNKPRPKNNLGKALLERRMFDEAEEQYLQEIALDPQSVSGHNNLGSIYGLQGDYEKALAEVNQALAINPSHDSSYNNLGNIYMLQGKFDEAEQAYERSVTINDRDAGVWANLGDIRIKKQEYEEAIEAFEKAVEQHEEKGLWHSKLGGLYGQKKRYEDAERELRRALQLDPDLTNAYVNLGNVWLEQQRWEEARGAYLAALRLNPKDAEVVTSLGQALWGLGQKEAAREAWQAVRQADPENQRVKELLDQI